MAGLRRLSRLIPDRYISCILVAVLALIGLPGRVGAQLAAQPATRSAELRSLGEMYHATLMERRPPGYYRMLESADPATQALNKDPDLRLMYFDSRGLPTYYGAYNAYAATVISTDDVWPAGITGYGLNGLGTQTGEMAIWDVGAVRSTHQEFGGRVAQMDTAVTTNFHSTHVAGTMVAGGVDPDAKGMSYRATLHAYEWDDDYAEMAAAAANGLLVSNHSYGLTVGWGTRGGIYWFGDVTVDVTEDYRFGFYDDNARTIDQIAYNAPYYLIVRAAGNDSDDIGPCCGNPHYHLVGETWVSATDVHQDDSEDNAHEDTLPPEGCAKNILTVGAIGKTSDLGNPLDVTYFSSGGPTDDGRIKPDVVALGKSVYSPSDESDTSYLYLDGTSMASPSVSGSVNLLSHHYKNYYGKLPLASSMRALVIHTAHQIRNETPPSARGGWGKMDTRFAAELIAGDGAGGGIMEATLQQGETHRYYFEHQSSWDKFTIAWTDPPGTPVAPSVDPPNKMLVNDLDMRMRYVESGTTCEPIIKDWTAAPPRPNLNGDNSRDNVERIDAFSATDKLIEVTITHKGTLAGGAQTYSLVWSGVTPRQPSPATGGPSSYATIDLGYPGMAPTQATTENEERGMFFTAIKRFDIDAIGFKMEIPCENTLVVRLYSASGSTRGSLLASGTVRSHQPGDVFHYVPLNYTLEPCQDYELAIEFQETIRWWRWDGRVTGLPYDVAGVIRVNGSQWNGNPGTSVIGEFGLVGKTIGDVTVSDLQPPGVSWGINTDAPGERGVFVTAEQTATVSAIKWGASFPAFSSQSVEASIYEASGTTRGALIARTNTTFFNISAGTKMVSVPINATLEEGRDYDLAVVFAPSWYQVKHESAFTLPYSVDGLLRVVDGEAAGDPGDSLLTHFGVNWTAGAGGVPHDLAKSGVPLHTSSTTGDPGAVVTSLIDQQLYSIGWMADVPAGATLGARVVEWDGINRPVVIAESEIVSASDGLRWHDVPIAVELQAGQGYILEMVLSAANTWEFWDDHTGMPYQAYGVVQVVEAVLSRDSEGKRLPRTRINVCNTTLTGVADRPVSPPSFALSVPYPNPTSGTSRVEYQLDEPATVWITIYDVAGRKVATVLDGKERPAGMGTAMLDTSSLPTGIYFVEMRSPAHRVARKITIVK